MLLMITRIYSVLLPISFHVFVIRDLMKSRYLDLFRLNLSGITAATATYDKSTLLYCTLLKLIGVSDSCKFDLLFLIHHYVTPMLEGAHRE